MLLSWTELVRNVCTIDELSSMPANKCKTRHIVLAQTVVCEWEEVVQARGGQEVVRRGSCSSKVGQSHAVVCGVDPGAFKVYRYRYSCFLPHRHLVSRLAYRLRIVRASPSAMTLWD